MPLLNIHKINLTSHRIVSKTKVGQYDNVGFKGPRKLQMKKQCENIQLIQDLVNKK